MGQPRVGCGTSKEPKLCPVSFRRISLWRCPNFCRIFCRSWPSCTSSDPKSMSGRLLTLKIKGRRIFKFSKNAVCCLFQRACVDSAGFCVHMYLGDRLCPVVTSLNPVSCTFRLNLFVDDPLKQASTMLLITYVELDMTWREAITRTVYQNNHERDEVHAKYSEAFEQVARRRLCAICSSISVSGSRVHSGGRNYSGIHTVAFLLPAK
jgi:hypothetical protein